MELLAWEMVLRFHRFGRTRVELIELARGMTAVELRLLIAFAKFLAGEES